jgi:hypothetical protein
MHDKDIFVLFMMAYGLCTMAVQGFLAFLLERRLRSFHAKRYLEMGEPTFFYDRHTARRMWLFIERREHKDFNDKVLSRISDLMGLWFFVYVVGLSVAFAFFR